MNRPLKFIILLVIAATLAGCCDYKEETPRLSRKIGETPAFEKGSELGVSAAYAAISDGYILIAGGCNFPEVPAAEGGKKRFYKGIYKASLSDTLQWEKAGNLPNSSAYGVSVQKNGNWIIAGGCNENGAQRDVYRLTIVNGEIKTDTLPPLPYTIDNGTGCIDTKNHLFIAGGNADGKASGKLLVLSLDNPDEGWEELCEMPQPRLQAVCTAIGGRICIWGGFTPADDTFAAKVHTDGLYYDIEEARYFPLNEISIDGESVTLSGGVLANTAQGKIITTGGVNKDIFLDAISGRYNLVTPEKYLLQPTEWYRFNNKLMQYDAENDQWGLINEEETFARAGATVVSRDEKLIYIGGELKPGIRTPEIHSIELPF